jgi:hypothetical protein
MPHFVHIHSRKARAKRQASERRLRMSTLQPRGEKMQKAIKWISESLQEDNKRTIPNLVQEAGMRFNLSPKEEEFLISFYRENPKGAE